jgi:hypothetical protein
LRQWIGVKPHQMKHLANGVAGARRLDWGMGNEAV